MSAATDGSNAGQSNRQTGEADSLDLDGRQTPVGALADSQTLKVIDSRHEGLLTVPSGALGAAAAREAATSDVAGLNSFTDKALQGRAAAVMGGRRQCGHRYAIRAGRNLPDKEFRYLRTVIVTAAVYRSEERRVGKEC